MTQEETAQGIVHDAADVLTAIHDAGGFLDYGGLLTAVGRECRDDLDRLVDVRYARSYRSAEAMWDLYQITDKGQRFVRPAFTFNPEAATAWLHSGGDPEQGGAYSVAYEAGIDTNWGCLAGEDHDHLHDPDGDIRAVVATFADAPADVFTVRPGYQLAVEPLVDEQSDMLQPLVWLPSGVKLAGDAEEAIHVIPQYVAAEGADHPGVWRLVEAMEALVGIANHLAERAQTAAGVYHKQLDENG